MKKYANFLSLIIKSTLFFVRFFKHFFAPKIWLKSCGLCAFLPYFLCFLSFFACDYAFAEAKETKEAKQDSLPTKTSTPKSSKANLPKLDYKSIIKTKNPSTQNITQDLTKEAFFESVEARNISLVKSKAAFVSLLESQKAYNAWDSPYTEIEGTQNKNGYGKKELEINALFILKPKLPWVQTLLHKSLNLQTLQYQKTYNLYKNLAFISAKQLYLSYLITKEKYHIYIHRESNFLSQLQIAKARVKAGSMSQKDYISFNNSYLDAKLLKMQAQTQLLDLQRQLHQILGIEVLEIIDSASSTQGAQNPQEANIQNAQESSEQDLDSPNIQNAHNDYQKAQDSANIAKHIEEQILSPKRDIVVKGLDFDYATLSFAHARESLKSSPYTEILDLQAKDYKTNAKIVSRERFDAIEIGAGVAHSPSSDGVQFRLSVPLPVTTKNMHLKRKFLALHSGALRENEITKTNLSLNLESYYEQLGNKKSYIELQKENIQNKKELVEMGKIAYEAQKISLFEYLTYQNAYMDSLITLANAKLEYIAIQSLLEETLGEMLDNDTK
ncbi:TolC family protein [Helicobacter sp. T3_23-1059]